MSNSYKYYTQYSRKESIEEIISRLDVLDGFTFHGIVKRQFTLTFLKVYIQQLCTQTVASVVISF